MGWGTVRKTLLAIAILCVSAPAADAATRIVVKGAGWGHGIGMSQYGAYGFALEGSDWTEILDHYYTGTRRSQAPSRPVRVLLQPNDPYIRFRGATDAEGTRLSSRTTYVARPSGSGISLRTAGGRRVGRFSSPLSVDAGGRPIRLLGPALNGLSSGTYRGTIEIRRDGGLTAINSLPIDPYVKGVVAGEMPSSWPLEALKAQAVAARTYALATRKPGGAFDQYPDVRSQVYRGVQGESVRSNAAVDQTEGTILTVAGQPAVTYFFSTSGGHTENVENVFLGSLRRSWLVGVPDPYDHHSPYHRWRRTFTPSSLDAALGAPGRFKRVRVTRRGASPRIVRARIEGTGGSVTLSGPTIRTRLGLRDTWASFVKVSASARRARSARAASWGGGPARLRLVGVYEPAPRKRRLALERRAGKRWKRLRVIRTDRAGHYRVSLVRAGVYRVRRGSVASPAARLR
jgi:SpoIID/LytB domain protein